MPLNIDKYVKKKKRNCLDIIKLCYKIHQRRYKNNIINKSNIWEKIKNFLNILIKIIIWGITYIIGIISLDNNYDSTISHELVTFLFFVIIYLSWASNDNYKKWLKQAEYDEFQRRFTIEYKPIGKFWPIVWLFIFAHYCNNSELVLLFIIWVSYDCWDRRFLTNDIKQDLILEKLKAKI